MIYLVIWLRDDGSWGIKEESSMERAKETCRFFDFGTVYIFNPETMEAIDYSP